mmetsp:Transcript_21103/g.47479  ORF Transcript_21103/g.47479 Transcript_21103/m.47479 type:complete len:521 (+) Transcript_21103:238-1800(+)
MDLNGLEIVINGDDEADAKRARKIWPLRENGNLLLCTLLLGNVAVNALLSILMANLTSGLVGGLISTVVIVIFGEIVPQATCSRYALQIGSVAVPIVMLFLLVLWPLTKPTAMVLDWALGEELGTIFSKGELKQLLEIHQRAGALDQETGRVLRGALEFEDKKIKSIMTAMDKVFMLSRSDRLDLQTMTKIFRAGFSRVPVYDNNENDVMGLLMTKDLIFVDPEHCIPLDHFIHLFGRSFLYCDEDDSCGVVFKRLKEDRCHLAVVQRVIQPEDKDPYKVSVGVVTLEDIVEEIIGDEILDETDVFVDMNNMKNKVDKDDRTVADMKRLRALLGCGIGEEPLSRNEVNAIASHLKDNCTAFSNPDSNGKALSDDQIRWIVMNAEVETKVRKTPARTAPKAMVPQDYLFHRGEAADSCLVCLSGKVSIFAGKDAFPSEGGMLTVLGAHALVRPDFRPDFSVCLKSREVRLIRISRDLYVRAFDEQVESMIVSPPNWRTLPAGTHVKLPKPIDLALVDEQLA